MENENTKRRSPIIRLLRFFLSIFLTVAILLGAAFAYLYTNQEQLRNALVTQVNDHLDAQVEVGEIKMDFFSQFPDVSFRFNEVFCKEVLPATSSDTLFYFDAVYFEFNLWQLIQSEYELKGITFEEGNVELRMYQNGTDNYHFWKETEDTAQSDLILSLDDVKFSNAKIAITTPDFSTSLNADLLNLHGMVQSGDFSSSLKWRGRVQSFLSNEIDWLPQRTIFAEIDFLTHGDSTFIQNGVVEIEGLRLRTDGTLTSTDQHWILSGESLNLARFISFIPSHLIPDQSLVEADGNLQLNLKLDIENELLKLAADTKVSSGKLSLKKSGLTLHNLQFAGHFDNGKRGRLEDARLQIEHIKAATATGNLTAHLEISNFVTPTIATRGNLDMSLQEALTLAQTSFWEIAEGTISGDFQIKKRYRHFKDIQESGLNSATMKGGLSLSDCRLKVLNSGLDMTDLQAELIMDGEDIQVKKLQFKSGSSDFDARGLIANALIFGETSVPTFRLNLTANRINLDDIFAWNLGQDNESSSESSFDFNYKLNVQIEELKLVNFTATQLTGSFYSEGKDIIGSSLNFNTCGGSTTGRFRWHPEGNVSLLSTAGTIQNVDIHELFTQFDNFGQTSLTAANLYGKAKSDFSVRLYFDQDLNPVTQSLISETDLTITEGRLVNYAPLEELSGFAEASALKDVHFATLQNHLSIADENIHIPGMTVQSNVLELWVQGDHRFDDYIDYSLKLKLLDAVGTRRRTNSELSEFITESNTAQPLIPIKIVGPMNDLSITLDRSLLQSEVVEGWENQGRELRDLLDGKNDPAQKEPEYIFEWNDTRDTTKK